MNRLMLGNIMPTLRLRRKQNKTRKMRGRAPESIRNFPSFMNAQKWATKYQVSERKTEVILDTTDPQKVKQYIGQPYRYEVLAL